MPASSGNEVIAFSSPNHAPPSVGRNFTRYPPHVLGIVDVRQARSLDHVILEPINAVEGRGRRGQHQPSISWTLGRRWFTWPGGAHTWDRNSRSCSFVHRPSCSQFMYRLQLVRAKSRATCRRVTSRGTPLLLSSTSTSSVQGSQARCRSW